MGSCLSELKISPKTVSSCQSTVVGDEDCPARPYKTDGDNKQRQRSCDLPKEFTDKQMARYVFFDPLDIYEPSY